MYLLSYSLTVFLLIASPGPIITLVLKASKNGIKSAATTIFGASIASLVLLCCAFTGLFFSLKGNDMILNVIKIFGGIYLLWLGFCCYRDNVKTLVDSIVYSSTGALKTFLVGISNPKDIIFLLSFLSGFVIPNDKFIQQAISLTIIWIIIDLIIMICYAEFAKKLFKYKLTSNVLHWLPIVIMPMVGIYAIYNGGYGLYRISG